MLKTHLTQSTPKTAQTKFIAIDGCGGSGKSTLAILLAEQLGAQVIQTNDFAVHESRTEWWPKLIGHFFDLRHDKAYTSHITRGNIMDTKFLEDYTAALNRATELTEKIAKKGVLDEVADAQLISDFHEANAEVERLNKILLSSQ